MTNSNKKQQKITKLFRKQVTQLPEDCEELEEEIKLLEEKLKEKQTELFQVQRSSYKRKLAPPKQREEIFVMPVKLITLNNIDNLERTIELMTMLTGMEVKSYVANNSCVIVYHMQHEAEHAVQHGLRIEMSSGENYVTKMSLPTGFNIKAVLEEFDNVMTPECLGSVRKALVAYYDRMKQFAALETLLSIEAKLFRVLDGTHAEVSFRIQERDDEEEEQTSVVLVLDYRLYDIRPKNYNFKDIDLPEGMADTLREQCALFKGKSLDKAFKEIFMDDIGRYKFVNEIQRIQAERIPTRRVRHRPDPRHDDTYRPDVSCGHDGSDTEDDDERHLRDLYGR